MHGVLDSPPQTGFQQGEGPLLFPIMGQDKYFQKEIEKYRELREDEPKPVQRRAISKVIKNLERKRKRHGKN